MQDMSNVAVRYNEGKVDWTYLPWDERMIEDLVYCLNINSKTSLLYDVLNEEVRHVSAGALLKLENNPNIVTYTTSNLPWNALEQVCRVYDFGAQKYARDNYKLAPGLPLEGYIQSMWRHLVEYLKGNPMDIESKLPHLSHLACNAFMYLWTQKEYHSNK
jgi:hypothetical protein